MTLKQDDHNANRGTDRGRQMVRDSLQRYGAGRSILVDKHGVAIAGNKTLDAATELGLPVRVIETTGDELVVVQRADLDLEADIAARELAYADNRVAEVSLDWDTSVLSVDAVAGVDLSAFFAEAELIDLFAESEDTAAVAVESSAAAGAERDGPVPTFRPVIALRQMGKLERALAATGASYRAEALLILCDAYLGEHDDAAEG